MVTGSLARRSGRSCISSGSTAAQMAFGTAGRSESENSHSSWIRLLGISARHVTTLELPLTSRNDTSAFESPVFFLSHSCMNLAALDDFRN